MVAGYEAVIAIGRACHPDLRQRGFHPAAAVGVFGAAMAAGKLRGARAREARQRARASRRRAPPGCSPSSMAAPTSSACTPATPRARACRPRCSPSRASRARPTSSRRATASCRPSPSAAPTRRARSRCRPRAVRHHRLLHQALPVLPAHPAGRRGADRPPARREHRDRGGRAHRRRDLSDRRRACRRPDGTISPAPS